ncbi:flagellar export chaperone FliS [Nocardioides caeni]|uniref:Flagellar export chaperone FliS n=1 Tax=Nocardioides caeni TaxID=574700 RepID=A0A4S8NHV0_9ACTN|nr:flagellar export chaperone FliS [Nocardioides caeni]THV14689.1 flagellar export chaperone FliS [Nocardioides caeni]
MYATTTTVRAAQAQSAYQGNAIATASPARLLVMLVERLVLDIERGLAAQQAASWPDAHRHLLHAQDIVAELEASLDVDKMPAGKQLASLYAWLREQLVRANVGRDTAVTTAALTLARQLCDTWREAAMASVG